MRAARIAITIDRDLLSNLDRLVKVRRFSNRSQVIQQALREKIDRVQQKRLARECAKLDRSSEQQLADEN